MLDELDAAFLAPPEDRWDVFWQNVVGSSPLLLAHVALLVIAACLVRRAPKPAVLLLAGSLLSMVAIVAFPIVHQAVMDRHWESGGDFEVAHRWMLALGLGASVIHAVAWLLVGFAVLAGRQATTVAPVAPHGHGVSPPPPPGADVSGGSQQRVLVEAPPIAKGPFLGAIVGGFVVSLLLAVPGLVLVGTARPRDEEQLITGATLSCASLVPAIVAAVALCVLIYKLWAALPRESARTSPGLAVGLLFVPLFNLYWIFQVYVGWRADFNRLMRSSGRPEDVRSTALPTAICVLTIASVVPFVGILGTLANMILLPIFLSGAIDGVNRLRMPAGS